MVPETISNAGKLNIMSEISEIIEDASIHDANECKWIYTAREDRLNSWSHFFGLGLSIIGLILNGGKGLGLRLHHECGGMQYFWCGTDSYVWLIWFLSWGDFKDA